MRTGGQLKIYDSFNLNNRGVTAIEGIIALGILSIIAISFIGFFGSERRLSIGSVDKSMCMVGVSQVINRLESGGVYSVVLPKNKDISALNSISLVNDIGFINSISQIYDLPDDADASRRASYINENMTVKQRFENFGVTPQVYSTAGANSHDYKTLSRQKGDVTGGKQNTQDLTTDSDGIISWMPFLTRGTVADLADLYNGKFYSDSLDYTTWQPVPDYLNELNNSNYILNIKIDRIKAIDLSIDNAGVKFWPIPRNGLGKYENDSKDKYTFRDPIDFFNRRSNEIFGAIDYGRGKTLIRFPTIEAGEAVDMSWDYGFRVHIKSTWMKPGGTDIIECQTSKEYFLPSDLQNMVNPMRDFDFLTDATNDADRVVDTHQVSDKFYSLIPGSKVAKSQTTNNYCSGSCGTPGFIIKEPKFLAIFSNSNFGYESYPDDPMAKYGIDRPECSQDAGLAGGTPEKEFHIVLRFKNLDKEPGTIPLCLDSSAKPSALQGYDSASDTPLSSYTWCEGGTSHASANGARVKIMNDFLPGQGGFVPCEKLRFCGQNPEKVEVKHFASGVVEYNYKLLLNNDDNTGKNNRLWGCDISFAPVLVDAAGNFSYLPAIKYDYTADQLDEIRHERQLGTALPAIAAVVPKIYAKPPPCYACGCKKCKGGKSFLGALVGIFIFAAFIYVALPALMTSLGSISIGAAFSPTMLFMGLGGTVFLAGAVCGLQMTGLTDGGACSPWTEKQNFGEFQSCRSEPSPNPCECGHTCSIINAPGPLFWEKDVPTDEPENPPAFCDYETQALVTNSIPWTIEMGLRDPVSQKIDSSRQAPVGYVSTYNYLNLSTGSMCYAETVCKFDKDYYKNYHKGMWVRKKGMADGVANQTLEYCGKMKVGFSIRTGATDDAITIDPIGSPACVMGEPTPNLFWDCSRFNNRCYNAETIYHYNDLKNPAGNLAWGGEYTAGALPPQNIDVPGANNLSFSNQPLSFARKTPPVCSIKTLPASGQQLVSEFSYSAALPTRHPSKPLNGNYMGTLYGLQFNNECTDKTDVTEDYPCDFSCSLSGASCTPSDPKFGSCAVNTVIDCPPSDGGGGGGGTSSINFLLRKMLKIETANACTTSYSCTATPNTCRRRRVNSFDNWVGCKVPEDFTFHMKTDVPNDGMVCYRDIYNKADHQDLPLCGTASGPLSSSLPKVDKVDY